MNPQNKEQKIIKEMIHMAEIQIEKNERIKDIWTSENMSLAAKFAGAAAIEAHYEERLVLECPSFAQFKRNQND